MSNTIRVYKDGVIEQIDAAYVDKFLEDGWSKKRPGTKKSKPKAKAVVKAKGEVLRPIVEKLEEQKVSTEESGSEDTDTTFRTFLTEEN